MKPARFILNSDFTTVRNTGSVDLSLTVPNNFTIPADAQNKYILGTISAKVGSAGDSFGVRFSTSLGMSTDNTVYGYTKPAGATTTSNDDGVFFRVYKNGDTFTFTIGAYHINGTAATFNGYGQTITAHIYTFKDPFSE